MKCPAWLHAFLLLSILIPGSAEAARGRNRERSGGPALKTEMAGASSLGLTLVHRRLEELPAFSFGYWMGDRFTFDLFAGYASYNLLGSSSDGAGKPVTDGVAVYAAGLQARMALAKPSDDFLVHAIGRF